MSTPNLPFNPEQDLAETAAIERGAVRGGTILIARSFLVLGVTAFATIALARLLSPSEYGAFAIALGVQALARQAVELGMPVAFIQRPEPPSVHEQRALTGLMLLIGAGLAGAAAIVCFGILPLAGAGGEIPSVIGVACLSLPLFGFRAVPAVLLERRLSFGRLALIEVSETFAFYLFAVPAAVAGLGAWSLAGAVPVSAAAGVAAAWAVQPWRHGVNLDLRSIGPEIRFGMRAAAVAPVYYARELGLAASLTVVGGQSLTGFYAMSQRLFTIPTAVMHAVWRVSMAGLSRTGQAERNRRALSAIGTTAVAVGLPIAAVTGAAEPLIDLLFGERWAPAAEVALFAAPGVMLMSSAGASLSGLCFADGDARSPLIAETAGAVAAIGLGFGLGSALGAEGAGIAAGAALALITLILISLSSVDTGRAASVALRTLVAVAAGIAAGRLIGGDDPVWLAIALIASGAVWLAVTALVARSELALLVGLVRRHVPGVRRLWPLLQARDG